jgi:hypothetical protein
MARTVRHAKLDSKTARAKLKKGRQPHFQELQPGIHLGYQREKASSYGRWLLRRYLGGGNRYKVVPLGFADDASKADGQKILDFDQAKSKALGMIDTVGSGRIERITVRQAMQRYVDWKRDEGQSVSDILSRGKAHMNLLRTDGHL